MAGCGEYNKKEDVYQVKGGGKVFCRTETDPDSIVGITNVRHIWGDEAGKYRLYFWENMQARADFYGCGIDLTTSPYALNWIYKELIKPHRRGERPDIELVQASSWENPKHSLSNITAREAKKATMDPRRFNMIYGGQWEKMEGLVYDCWDDAANLVEPFQLPNGTRYFGGIDWGSTHPFVLKIRAVTPEGLHYGVSEFYKSNMTISEQIEVVKQKKQIFGVEMFYCDPSRPEYIAELNAQKCPAMGADNALKLGIDKHYELIKTRRYKEFIGHCPHSLDERETYHYPEIKDLGPDQWDKEPDPVKQNDDCMDVDRYLSMMTSRTTIKIIPKLPEGGVKSGNRLERLKKAHLKTGTEDWS